MYLEITGAPSTLSFSSITYISQGNSAKTKGNTTYITQPNRYSVTTTQMAAFMSCNENAKTEVHIQDGNTGWLLPLVYLLKYCSVSELFVAGDSGSDTNACVEEDLPCKTIHMAFENLKKLQSAQSVTVYMMTATHTAETSSVTFPTEIHHASQNQSNL